MFPERRASPREPLSLPITLAGDGTAMTRDISEHGLFLYVPRGSAVAEWLSFEFAVPQVRLKFDAVGEVVRIEPGIGHVGVAIRLHRPRLVALN
ncbi:PilZ domain-containing protein [Ramlibacter tataouinensis]|uniref:PilZ domain-containing protein n=1 Tax=Ramlibacter tataouinensis TaxID=94132 RepID=UPI0022F3FEA6|nr:PilZ domain-containing protein [Ramlibacter tataouinensis]WBY02596.1 PilZ domain-containing protein [Ramlibacter tataouinensis]